jgi:hypothetical protein
MEAWRVEAENLLRLIAPRDFDGAPIYICIRSEVTEDFDGLPGCNAYTAVSLDKLLQPILEYQGRWQGRGFATVVHEGRFRASHRHLAPWELEEVFMKWALHEVAHYFDIGRAMSFHEWGGPMLKAVASALRDPPPKKNPWSGHESSFIRAALHIHHRANAVGFTIRSADMSAAGEQYGLAPIEQYAEVLGDEPSRRIEESLFDIIDSKPPTEFEEFAARDFENAKVQHAKN